MAETEGGVPLGCFLRRAILTGLLELLGRHIRSGRSKTWTVT
jgi:hypothetical protein